MANDRNEDSNKKIDWKADLKGNMISNLMSVEAAENFIMSLPTNLVSSFEIIQTHSQKPVHIQVALDAYEEYQEALSKEISANKQGPLTKTPEPVLSNANASSGTTQNQELSKIADLVKSYTKEILGEESWKEISKGNFSTGLLRSGSAIACMQALEEKDPEIATTFKTAVINNHRVKISVNLLEFKRIYDLKECSESRSQSKPQSKQISSSNENSHLFSLSSNTSSSYGNASNLVSTASNLNSESSNPYGNAPPSQIPTSAISSSAYGNAPPQAISLPPSSNLRSSSAYWKSSTKTSDPRPPVSPSKHIEITPEEYKEAARIVVEKTKVFSDTYKWKDFLTGDFTLQSEHLTSTQVEEFLKGAAIFSTLINYQSAFKMVKETEEKYTISVDLKLVHRIHKNLHEAREKQKKEDNYMKLQFIASALNKSFTFSTGQWEASNDYLQFKITSKLENAGEEISRFSQGKMKQIGVRDFEHHLNSQWKGIAITDPHFLFSTLHPALEQHHSKTEKTVSIKTSNRTPSHFKPADNSNSSSSSASKKSHGKNDNNEAGLDFIQQMGLM